MSSWPPPWPPEAGCLQSGPQDVLQGRWFVRQSAPARPSVFTFLEGATRIDCTRPLITSCQLRTKNNTYNASRHETLRLSTISGEVQTVSHAWPRVRKRSERRLMRGPSLRDIVERHLAVAA